MSWAPLELLNPPKELEKSKDKCNKSQVISPLFENEPVIETINFTRPTPVPFEKKQSSEIKIDEIIWSKVHLRHKIRICASLILLIILLTDLALNILRLPSIFGMFSDIVAILGAFGLLGTSVYLTIDSTKS